MSRLSLSIICEGPPELAAVGQTNQPRACFICPRPQSAATVPGPPRLRLSWPAKELGEIAAYALLDFLFYLLAGEIGQFGGPDRPDNKDETQLAASRLTMGF